MPDADEVVDDGVSLDDVDVDDADRARIDYLSSDSDISEEEAERIVRFARLPRKDRKPSMLRIAGNGSKATRDASRDGSDDGGNGSGGVDAGVCADIRRRMRKATRTTDVVERYPDKHPSAIFRHAEGRCACDVDVDATTSPRVGESECLDMRRAFRQGATKRDVMADFFRSANAVNKHLFGRCDHSLRRSNPATDGLSTTECGHLREAYRRNASASVADLAAAYLLSSSTTHKHLRGKCAHDVDVGPIDAVELTDDDCAGMRRDYKRDPRSVVARIARNHDTTRPTADYHIFGRCECDNDESPANRR